MSNCVHMNVLLNTVQSLCKSTLVITTSNSLQAALLSKSETALAKSLAKAKVLPKGPRTSGKFTELHASLLSKGTSGPPAQRQPQKGPGEDASDEEEGRGSAFKAKAPRFTSKADLLAPRGGARKRRK